MHEEHVEIDQRDVGRRRWRAGPLADRLQPRIARRLAVAGRSRHDRRPHRLRFARTLGTELRAGRTGSRAHGNFLSIGSHTTKKIGGGTGVAGAGFSTAFFT